LNSMSMKYLLTVLIFLSFVSRAKTQNRPQVEKIEEVKLKGYVILLPHDNHLDDVGPAPIERILFNTSRSGLTDSVIPKKKLRKLLNVTYDFIEPNEVERWLRPDTPFCLPVK